jgi:uncharacterized protein (DUF885 family)
VKILALLWLAAGSHARFADLEKRYVTEFLRRNPVVATYLGASALDPSLSKIDGDLRDWSETSIAAEDRFYRGIRRSLAAIPARALSASERIDREATLSQIDFLLHQDSGRRYWRRALDTYVNEAFRGVDWQMQGMAELPGGRRGTREEWQKVVERVSRIPAYLAIARENIDKGVEAGDWPDSRMIERDGLAASEENAKFFAKGLMDAASPQLTGSAYSALVLSDLHREGARAAIAFRKFRSYLVTRFVEAEGGAGVVFAQRFRADHFAVGEAEYAWRLRHALRVDEPVVSLFERSTRVVEDERNRLVEAARKVADARGMRLDWASAAAREASTRAVVDELAKDYPKTDEEMLGWYRDASLRLVEFARRNAMFEIPKEYRLEVVVTPPALEASVDGAGYYPAPVFKESGVGRFYASPTHGDVEKLKQNNRASIADLSAHEGFPGHDWHYKVMTVLRRDIAPVRWLTPGEVEGSSSMWEDSMASEGWAHYGEALMAEPQPKDPNGFYTPEELVYELQGALYRDLRVRIDVGLHTGKIGFSEAVDIFSETVDFLPGSCSMPGLSPVKAASCDSARSAIFRYSKWPTQAITYRLGKERILAMRAQAQKILPGAEGERRFHMLFMRQGTIPPDLFRDELLAQMKRKP